MNDNKSDYTETIIFLGNEKVGKTCIINSICIEEFSDVYNPTNILDKYIRLFSIDGKNITLKIWDLSGREAYRNFIRSFIPHSSGAIIVYDVTDENSFDDAQQWVAIVREFEENKIIVLVGNKLDLNEERKISFEKAEEFAIKMNLHYFETSAKDGKGIDDFLTYIVTKIYHSLISNTI